LENDTPIIYLFINYYIISYFVWEREDTVEGWVFDWIGGKKPGFYGFGVGLRGQHTFLTLGFT